MVIWQALLDSFLHWGLILISPFQHFELLWIMIPIYINTVLTEFFQEKEGTNRGNAITNSFVLLWVGMEWTRELFGIEHSFTFWLKLGLAIVTLGYGFFVLYKSLKNQDSIHFLGRRRVISYILLMLTPIFYGVIEFSFYTVAVIFLYSVPFYLVVELIDRIIPTPKM